MNDMDRLKSLTNWQIARLLMSFLWQGYSSAGINIGRSLQAALLESITNITERPQCSYDLNFLLREAENRKCDDESRQLVMNMGLTGLSSQYFFCFVVRELRRWYEVNAVVDSQPILILDRRIIGAISSLLQVDGCPKQFDFLGVRYEPKELIKEGEERLYSLNDFTRSMCSTF